MINSSSFVKKTETGKKTNEKKGGEEVEVEKKNTL